MIRTADAVIIGGGVIGCSIAFHLLQRDHALKVVVLEREPMVGMGSTSKATGGIRHQFSSEAHIRLTQLSLPLYLRFEKETGYSVHFRPHGYLFVTSDPRAFEGLRHGVTLQQSLGIASRIITPTEAAWLVPGLRTEDLLGASVCDQDGTAEPAAAVQGFAAAARGMGAQILPDHEVTALLRNDGHDSGRMTGARTPHVDFHSSTVVIAAGPYSAQVAAMAGMDIPAHPYRRQVSVAAPIPELDGEIPLTIDMDSGFYIHRLGRGELLLGGTDKDTRPGFSLDIDWQGVERVLSAGVRRIPALERARVRRTYVGLRTLTPDHHPVIGRVAEVDGLVLACGDSGHGFMHAPAIGHLAAEEILDGHATTMDLTPFRLERFRRAVRQESNVF